MDKTNNITDSIIRIGNVDYSLKRIVDKTATDIHHLIWKRYRHQYRTNAEENKVRINRRKHIALNQFFGDKQNPREQLIEVFNLVKPVLTPWVRRELHTILELTDDEMFYIPEVLLWYKQKKKRQERLKSEQKLKNWQEQLFKKTE
jgi:hypothetical protein